MKVAMPPGLRRATLFVLASAVLLSTETGGEPHAIRRNLAESSEDSAECTVNELNDLSDHFTSGCWPSDWGLTEVDWRQKDQTEEQFFCGCLFSYLESYGYFPDGCNIPEVHDGLKPVSGRSAYDNFEHLKCDDWELDYNVPQLTNVTVPLLDAGEVEIFDNFITVYLNYWDLLQSDADHNIPGQCSDGGLGYQIRTMWNHETDFAWTEECSGDYTGDVYWTADHRGRKIVLGDLSDRWGPLRLGTGRDDDNNWTIESSVEDADLLRDLSQSLYHGMNNISDYSIVFICSDGSAAFCAGMDPWLVPSTDPRTFLPVPPTAAVVVDDTPFVIKAIPMFVGIGSAAVLVAVAGAFCYWRRRKRKFGTWSWNAVPSERSDPDSAETVTCQDQFQSLVVEPASRMRSQRTSQERAMPNAILSEPSSRNYSTFATAHTTRATSLKDSLPTSPRMTQAFKDSLPNSPRVTQAYDTAPRELSMKDRAKLLDLMTSAGSIPAANYAAQCTSTGSHPGPNSMTGHHPTCMSESYQAPFTSMTTSIGGGVA